MKTKTKDAHIHSVTTLLGIAGGMQTSLMETKLSKTSLVMDVSTGKVVEMIPINHKYDCGHHSEEHVCPICYKEREKLLVKAKDAITLAILSDDGLDGDDGLEIIKQIEQSLSPNKPRHTEEELNGLAEIIRRA